ncbi:MAG: hypothetical protein KDK39_16430 [Leptospiraceae bacterium]|nr:hypothetical protein [Leptospiraceae bacterium]
MSRTLLIKSWSRPAALKVHAWLQAIVAGSRYEGQEGYLFQVCDELIKNAIKANYKFLILWQETRQRMLAETALHSPDEADEWIREVFYSGEDILIRQQLDKMKDLSAVMNTVRQLLDLESKLNHYKDQSEIIDPAKRQHMADQIRDRRKSLAPLMELKAMARQLGIFTHFKIDRNPDKILITVSNDAPLLKEDLDRIQRVRERFQEYARNGRTPEFFAENLDTSGGGHGLGYALMDCTLMELGLEPADTLFLIHANKAMVLLSLPL